MDKLMIFGATWLIYLTAVLVLTLGLKGGIREKKAFLLIIFGLPITILLIKLIHLIYFEPRPFVTYHFIPLVTVAPDASFPSRHATIAAVIAFSYAYSRSKWAFLFLPIMLWIGISRVYVGVHYPWDIVGGFVTAIIALVIVVQIKKRVVSQIYPHF